METSRAVYASRLGAAAMAAFSVFAFYSVLAL